MENWQIRRRSNLQTLKNIDHGEQEREKSL